MPATKKHPACTIHEDGMSLPLWMDQETVTYANISRKMVSPRDIARNAEEEECGRSVVRQPVEAYW